MSDSLNKEYQEYFESRTKPCDECGLPYFLCDMVVYSAMHETSYLGDGKKQRTEQRAYMTEARKAIKSYISDTVAKATENVNRIEVIDNTGRAYVKGTIYGTPVKVELSFQDDDRTLKVFVKPQQEEE